MTYRVEIAGQVDRDADAILEWLRSQHATDAAVAWFHGSRRSDRLASAIPLSLPARPRESGVRLRGAAAPVLAEAAPVSSPVHHRGRRCSRAPRPARPS